VQLAGRATLVKIAEDRDRQFQAVFSESADALLLLDDQGVIADANRVAERLFGTPRNVLHSRHVETLLIGGSEPLQAAMREVLALGEARRELRFSDGSGGSRLVECSFRARVNGDRHLCVARDVTDRRLLEERIIQSEKIESIGRLAGGIAHDFNNLLTAILGYAELLLGQKPQGDPDRPDLEEIQKAGTRAAALTQQLLAFSRKQVLQPKDVDLNQTVSSLETMLRRLIREDIQLTCLPAGMPAVVKIDPTQIEQVILNLVLNARDALPGGGHIRVEVAVVPHHAVKLPADLAVVAAEYVRLVVTDDGVGIAPDALPHLFEPFFTTKDIGKGTGLGLASVHGIVHQSNGFITVESTPGAGARFTMHFPSVGPSALAGDVETAFPAAAGGHETVLLVEDEPAVRAIIATVLRRQGYQVLEAAAARAAMDVVERHSGHIDLLVTDVVMPEINGPALAQRLVASQPALRILFISGYADRMLPLNNGNPNVGFLGKPFQASALAAKVREVLTAPS
jgi:two-component system, cell cycle sensor histidine kinase and response regulator CckA